MRSTLRSSSKWDTLIKSILVNLQYIQFNKPIYSSLIGATGPWFYNEARGVFVKIIEGIRYNQRVYAQDRGYTLERVF